MNVFKDSFKKYSHSNMLSTLLFVFVFLFMRLERIRIRTLCEVFIPCLLLIQHKPEGDTPFTGLSIPDDVCILWLASCLLIDRVLVDVVVVVDVVVLVVDVVVVVDVAVLVVVVVVVVVGPVVNGTFLLLLKHDDILMLSDI